MKNRGIASGLILVFIGLFLLMTNLGIISWSLLDVMFSLWPIALIVIGINVIFRDRKTIKYLTWGIFFIMIIVFGFYQQYKFGDARLINKDSDIVIENRVETTNGKLNLQLGSGEIRMDSTDDNLISANIPKARVDKDVRFTNDNTKVNIDIEQKSDFFQIGNRKSHVYKFSLKDDLLWDIDIDIGAIDGTMDFSNIRLEKLDIDMGASDLNLIFGDKVDHTIVNIDGGVSDLQITIPENLGVRIDMDSFINDTNINRLGWRKGDDYYFSPNYEVAEKKLDIDIDMAIGDFNIKVK
ncbi:LiaI-LiaF-like domain-containing protein [Wukongibacter sp. M2B1]|uniref:LiaI-LiaF-like domain-containing protein n=1 Tax=Wukongibacter sp. M2B1 TaxID=3088895 RepID=UPI003D7B06B9